jgi:polysaccharide pyruvyl transferase WcaK-like protein
MAGGRPLRVGLYGLFGTGNIGNEASLAAVLAHLRSVHPEAEVVCFGADAREVEREHGIPARQLMTFRATPGDRRLTTQGRKVLGRLWDIPRTWWLVGRVDVLVVPGTGVLESRLTASPWGLPYWMAVAFTAARLRRRRAALVGVGAEPPPALVTRLLMRQVVRSATYVSYRDGASRRAAQAAGAFGSPGGVAPDVVFSLPGPQSVGVRPGHVVIGVMTYSGGAGNGTRGADAVQVYLARMTDLVTRLLDDGRSVTLVVGDRADLTLAQELARRARGARPAARDAVLTSGARCLPELMAEFATAEVVVASRFHNVIGALKCRCPVVSLGYAGKNADLLEKFGLGGFEQSIDQFDVDRVLADVARLTAIREAVVPVVEGALLQVERDATRHLDAVWAALLEAHRGALPLGSHLPV